MKLKLDKIVHDLDNKSHHYYFKINKRNEAVKITTDDDGVIGHMNGQINIAAPVWTTSGGLSLLIDIPTDGKVYNFSKVSGGARLSLGVRPHQTWQFALGLVWTVTWLVILAVIGWALTRHGAVARLLREAPWFLIALGTVTYFLVRRDADLGLVALTAFVVGALWLAFRKPAKAQG